MTTMEQNLAVFTTSEIFTMFADAKNPQEPKAVLQDGTKVYSTGCLERALAVGFVVYVVTTRSKLMDHDKWWMKLVDSDRVFLTEEGGMYDPRRDEIMMTPWRRLFEAVEIEFPEGKYHFWSALRAHIEDYGFVRGHDFK